MEENDYFAQISKQVFSLIESQNDNDFEIDDEQYAKLLHAVAFFYEAAKCGSGSVEPCHLVPKYEHGGVTAYFRVFDLDQRRIKEFCKVLQNSSSATIDSTTDGFVCVSLTIPNIFKKNQ